MDRQRLVDVSEGENGENGRGKTQGLVETNGLVGGMNLEKRGVKRMGSGLDASGTLEKAWPVVAYARNVSSEMDGMVEEMRELGSLLVGSTN